jgi:hypothetical protein
MEFPVACTSEILCLHFSFQHLLSSNSVRLLRFPLMSPSALSRLREDFKVTTWLYTGAFLQALIFLLYPSRLVALPAILSIVYSVSQNLLLRFGIIRDPSFDQVSLGKFTAQLVENNGSLPSSSGDKGLVVFIFGARSNQ